MITAMIVKCIQAGDIYLVLLALVGLVQAFYFSTLEEYYTGGLFLGLGNGVTDGSILVSGFFFFTAIAGTDVFR